MLNISKKSNYHTSNRFSQSDKSNNQMNQRFRQMNEWKEYRLGDVCEFLNGRAYKANEFKESGTPIVRIQNLTGIGNYVYSDLELPENKYINAGDLIYAWSATFGPYIWKGEKSIYHYHIWKIECDEKKIDKHYFFYYLLNASDKLKESGNGTLFIHITKKLMESFSILLPPLPTQAAIAEILSSLDDKIDLLHRQNKTLEQLAETLFRKWFVEEAEESWEVGTLEDEFDFTMGQSPTGDTLNEEKRGMIFYQGRSDFGFRFPEPRVYTTAPTRIAKPLDTLVSVRAPVGDMNMAFEECCLGRGVAAFRYKHNNAFFSYTYYKLRSLMQSIKQFEDSGTVFGSIGKDDFKKLESTIPTIEAVEAFQTEAKPNDDKILLNHQQIRTLTRLRDTLLPKLMSGEVKVSNCGEI